MDAITVSVTAAAAIWVAWCIWYTISAQWWKIEAGRNTFLVSAALAIVLSRISWARLDQGFKEQAWIAVTIYTIAALAGIGRFLLQRKARRELKEKH